MTTSPKARSVPLSERLYHALKWRLAPGLRNSQYDYADELIRQSARAEAWLDIGCGHHVVPDWVDSPARQLTPLAGIDLDLDALRRNAHVRLRSMASGEALPFRAAVFDLVTANMVVEHVFAPELLFGEVARVLRPGGRFVIHTPNVGGYTTALAQLVPAGLRARVAALLHGRASEDVYPTHYHANSSAALHACAGRAGFDVRSLVFVRSSAQLIRVPPLLVPEMLWIRALESPRLAGLRPCLLAIFERRADR